jgi:hypothetical protein
MEGGTGTEGVGGKRDNSKKMKELEGKYGTGVKKGSDGERWRYILLIFLQDIREGFSLEG